VSAAVISGGVALMALLLGRWGLRNAAELTPTGATAQRRARDERSIRRGARSLLVMSALFAVLALLALLEVIPGGTTR